MNSSLEGIALIELQRHKVMKQVNQVSKFAYDVCNYACEGADPAITSRVRKMGVEAKKLKNEAAELERICQQYEAEEILW